MIPQRNDAHVAQGTALLTGDYKDKPVISGILKALLSGTQKLEQDVWELLWAWVLEHGTHNASNSRLDDLGAIVGEAREGRTDEVYRPAIRTRIRINRSKGRTEDVLQVAKMIDPTATYVEGYPLGFEVAIYEVQNAQDIVRMLARTKAATSYGVLLTSNWDDELAVWDYL